jgi:hypothetical protein
LFHTSGVTSTSSPRFLANLTLTLGVDYARIPAVFVFGCLPVYFLLWLRIFSRLELSPVAKTFAVLPPSWCRLANEIFMNQTNLQWVMRSFPSSSTAAGKQQASRREYSTMSLLTFCVFTGPYVLFLFPIFAAAAVIEKQVKQRALFLAIWPSPSPRASSSLMDVARSIASEARRRRRPMASCS